MVISLERALASRWEVTFLLLETIVAFFVQERPLWVRARAVLERLGEAPRLDALWARTAPPLSPRALVLASLGQRMRAGVLGGQPTGHVASHANQEALGGAPPALDHTRERVATAVAAALVRAAAALADPGGQAVQARPPRSLRRR